MALDTISTARLEITKIYIAAFNRAPDAAGLSNWMNQYTSGKMTYTQISQDFSNQTEYTTKYPSAMTDSEYITKIYVNVFGRQPDDGGLTNWVNQLTASATTGATRGNIMKTMLDAAGATGNTDGLRLTNQATFAVQAVVIDGVSDVTATAQLANITSDSATVATATAAVASSANTGTSYSLTTAADTLSGTSGNDTYNADQTTGTWTLGDTINGGAGTDTLKLIKTAAIVATDVAPVGAVLTSVENLTLISGAGLTAVLTTGTGLASVTNVTTSSVGASALTSSATQDVNATVTTHAATAVTIDGGKNVALTNSGSTTGTIAIGGTTAAAGTVTVTASGVYTDSAATTNGTVGVTGGTTITVNQTSGITAAQLAAGAIDTTNAGFQHTESIVTATGNASTTAVTVTQEATRAAVDFVAATSTVAAIAGVLGVTAGAVNILDANRASLTAAGTIATATITNAGAATVNSGALTALNLAGTLVTVDAGTLGALTTATNHTLALGLTGAVSTGAVTIDSDITTLNIAGNTTTNTINSLVASGATTINVSGNALVTLTANTTAVVTAITVTNTAGASFGTAIGTGVTFTGGAGADGVAIGAHTKAIDMGAGNDTVTATAALATGGSVNGGDGTDTLVINAASFTTAGYTNFETLGLGALATGSYAATGFTGITMGTVTGGVTLTSVANNVNLTYTATVGQTSALTLAADTSADNVNVTLRSALAINANTLTAANYETMAITTVDTGTVVAAHQDTLALTATSLTSLTVAGNAGLALTTTGATSLSTVNASGITDGVFTYTATDITGTTTITGGAGADVITGAGAADTINGGAGNDILAGGTGADIIDGGTGVNTYAATTSQVGVTVEGTGTGTSTGLVINLGSTALTSGAINTLTSQNVAGTLGEIAAGKVGYLFGTSDNAFAASLDTLSNIDNVTGSTGIDYIVGNANANTITGGLGIDYITITETTQTADHVVFTSGLSIDSITGFASGSDKADFSLAALETAGATFAGLTMDFVTGLGVSVAAGDTMSMLAVTGAVSLTSANVLNYTAATVANAAALELALEAGGGILTTGATGVTADDATLIMYDNGTNIMLAVVTYSATVGATTKVAAVDVADIATLTGVTTDLVASDFSFIA